MESKDSAKVATVVCNKCGSDLVRVSEGNRFKHLCAYCLSKENERLLEQSKGVPLVATYFEEDYGWWICFFLPGTVWLKSKNYYLFNLTEEEFCNLYIKYNGWYTLTFNGKPASIHAKYAEFHKKAFRKLKGYEY